MEIKDFKWCVWVEDRLSSNLKSIVATFDSHDYSMEFAKHMNSITTTNGIVYIVKKI